MSRAPHKPTDKTRAEVSALYSFGVPLKDVAAYIGITDKTLSKHYADELARAKTQAHGNVAKFLYKAASGAALEDGASYADCVRAAMFWAKTQMGFRETHHVDHSSEDGTMSPPASIRIEFVTADNDTDTA